MIMGFTVGDLIVYAGDLSGNLKYYYRTISMMLALLMRHPLYNEMWPGSTCFLHTNEISPVM
jgi:hypothetical protein